MSAVTGRSGAPDLSAAREPARGAGAGYRRLAVRRVAAALAELRKRGRGDRGIAEPGERRPREVLRD